MAAYFVYCSDEGTRSRRFAVEFLEGSRYRNLGRFSIPAIWIRNEDLYMKGFNSKLWADVFRRKTSGSWRRI